MVEEPRNIDERIFIETVIGEISTPPGPSVFQEPLLLSEMSQSEFEGDERTQLLCDLEALLFVTGEPLALPRLATLTGRHPSEVAEAIAILEERYARCGITIRSVGGGYRFATAPRARQAVESLLLPPKTSLSPAALETLAVVAYSQPVTKAEIEAVRGVSVDGIVSSLVEKGFLVEAGRKDVVGRPMLFVTTQEFLQSFGLPSLADLPPLPGEHMERLAEAGDALKALEGTAESGILPSELTVEIEPTSLQGESLSQP